MNGRRTDRRARSPRARSTRIVPPATDRRPDDVDQSLLPPWKGPKQQYSGDRLRRLDTPREMRKIGTSRAADGVSLAGRTSALDVVAIASLRARPSCRRV